MNETSMRQGEASGGELGDDFSDYSMWTCIWPIGTTKTLNYGERERPSLKYAAASGEDTWQLWRRRERGERRDEAARSTTDDWKRKWISNGAVEQMNAVAVKVYGGAETGGAVYGCDGWTDDWRCSVRMQKKQ